VASSLTTWPNSAWRLLLIISAMFGRPVLSAMSMFLIWSCHFTPGIWRWHDIWKDCNLRASSASKVHVSAPYNRQTEKYPFLSKLYRCVCAACSMRHVSRRAACFSVLLWRECVLRDDTMQCCSATSGVPFGCSVLLIWRHVSSVVDTRCFLLCADMLAGMLELDVHTMRPGCRGRAYACLRLYAFDRDNVPCWPTCTRCTPADSCATTNRGSQSTTSSANVSVNSQRIYHLMTWTICISTVITRLVAVHL